VNARSSLAILVGKAAGRTSRLLRRGGGTAIAGVVALRIDPHLVSGLIGQVGHGWIAVTGTNGKTTTSLMLSRIAEAAGLGPLHNRSGSNLMRGVAAMLVEQASASGRLSHARDRLAILEIDEATLPEIVREAQPRAIVFTNLFRDQLDRYGEVDAVAASWRRALAEPGSGTHDGLLSSSQASGLQHPAAPQIIVLNADDPAVAHLGRGYRGEVVYYGVEDVTASADSVEHASDFRNCLECGGELSYSATFYGHVGHWRCPSCGNTRPSPDVRLTRLELDPGGSTLEIDARGAPLHVRLPLNGLYNAYNALAAAAGAVALGLPHDAIVTALEGFSAAFGRQERFSVRGRDIRVLLGKNPTGLNQVLRTIAATDGPKRIIFFLNDGVADGRDVSWIWDADYEVIQAQTCWSLAAGNRAEDLALRLKYAGLGDDVPIERNAVAALRRGIDVTPQGETLYVLPTYTAMLEARELLAKWAGDRHYWEIAWQR
jgi:UDP-N-acetylmuramyl tripeptide synthase